MVNAYGVNYTKGLPTTSGSMHSRMVDANENGSEVSWIHDTFEATASVTGTLIYLGKTPGKGFCAGGYFYYDALSSGTVMSVGTVDDDDVFAVDFDTTSAGSQALGVLPLTEIGAGVDIVATVVSGTVSGTLELSMLWAY